MKKNFLTLLLGLCTISGLSQKNNWFTLKAFLPRWNGAEISLFSNNQLLYTGKVANDMFDFTGNIILPAQGSLKLKAGKIVVYIPVFLERGTIKIRDAGGKSLAAFGTPANNLYVELNKSFDSLAAQQKNTSFQNALAYKRELAGNFILSNPSSIVSVQLLKDYYYLTTEANDSLYYLMVHSLSKELQQSYYVQEMIKEANQRNNTAIGHAAPYTQARDTVGQSKDLYRIGEYTLVDFWASWCVPCRKENSQLKKVFLKYRQHGFNISSVSLDNNKPAWISALRQDKMLWNQFSDLKGWDSPLAISYGIKVIPMNYLINKEGLIIAKNLYADQLDGLLNRLIFEGVNL